MPSITPARRPGPIVLQAAWLLCLAAGVLGAQTPRQVEPQRITAIGVKVGEVTQTTTLVWTRVPRPTEEPIRRRRDLRGFLAALLDSPPDLLVRLRYGTNPNLSQSTDTGWLAANQVDDYTLTFELEELQPGRRYWFEVRAAHEDETPLHEPRRGTFRTAPPKTAAERVVFTAITGQAYHDLDDPQGFRIYDSMLQLEPDFLVATGDSVYYDRGTQTVRTKEEARERWRQMYQLPRLLKFHAIVPAYFEKDDHDLYGNDYWPGKRPNGRREFTYEDGLDVFREHNPVPETPYRTIRWGRAVQIWLTEVREFRSPNNVPDGPSKTIWGEAQTRWLRSTIQTSDADWRILINPTPIVGPDRGGKGDNHANKAFLSEGREFRQWFSSLGYNFMVIAGDRHWQYHSVDPETGLEEFGCGPASDLHAGGSPGFEPDYHRFHRVAGGFLSVTAEPATRGSRVALRLHDVDGKVVHEQVRTQTGE